MDSLPAEPQGKPKKTWKLGTEESRSQEPLFLVAAVPLTICGPQARPLCPCVQGPPCKMGQEARQAPLGSPHPPPSRLHLSHTASVGRWQTLPVRKVITELCILPSLLFSQNRFGGCFSPAVHTQPLCWSLKALLVVSVPLPALTCLTDSWFALGQGSWAESQHNPLLGARFRRCPRII